MHLGGTLGATPRFGRKVRGVRVYGEDLAAYVEMLLRRYETRRNGHRSFAEFVNALDDEKLASLTDPDGGL